MKFDIDQVVASREEHRRVAYVAGWFATRWTTVSYNSRLGWQITMEAPRSVVPIIRAVFLHCAEDRGRRHPGGRGSSVSARKVQRRSPRSSDEPRYAVQLTGDGVLAFLDVIKNFPSIAKDLVPILRKQNRQERQASKLFP